MISNLFKSKIKMDSIRSIWKASNYPTPTVLLGIYNNEYYVTVADHQTIVTFASKRQGIYVATKKKCQVIPAGIKGEVAYYITEPDALQIISCTNPITEVDRFVTSKIVPVVFNQNLSG
jgi:hypothetical protein